MNNPGQTHCLLNAGGYQLLHVSTAHTAGLDFIGDRKSVVQELVSNPRWLEAGVLLRDFREYKFVSFKVSELVDFCQHCVNGGFITAEQKPILQQVLRVHNL